MAEIDRLTVFGFATSERSLTDKKDIMVFWVSQARNWRKYLPTAQTSLVI
jgi:hypothetical protein